MVIFPLSLDPGICSHFVVLPRKMEAIWAGVNLSPALEWWNKDRENTACTRRHKGECRQVHAQRSKRQYRAQQNVHACGTVSLLKVNSCAAVHGIEVTPIVKLYSLRPSMPPIEDSSNILANRREMQCTFVESQNVLPLVLLKTYLFGMRFCEDRIVVTNVATVEEPPM